MTDRIFECFWGRNIDVPYMSGQITSPVGSFFDEEEWAFDVAIRFVEGMHEETNRYEDGEESAIFRIFVKNDKGETYVFEISTEKEWVFDGERIEEDD